MLAEGESIMQGLTQRGPNVIEVMGGEGVKSLRPQGIVNVAVALLDATRAVPLYDAPGSPGAFAVKDLAVVRRPASLCRIAEETDADEEQSNAAFVDPRGAAVEQRKLELKLEKSKADLSPGNKQGKRGGTRRWVVGCASAADGGVEANAAGDAIDLRKNTVGADVDVF